MFVLYKNETYFCLDFLNSTPAELSINFNILSIKCLNFYMCVIVSSMMLVLFVSSNLYIFLDLLHWLGPTIKCGIEVVRMGKCYFTIKSNV